MSEDEVDLFDNLQTLDNKTTIDIVNKRSLKQCNESYCCKAVKPPECKRHLKITSKHGGDGAFGFNSYKKPSEDLENFDDIN